MSHEEPRRDFLPGRLTDVAPSPAAAVYAKAARFEGANRFDATVYGSKGSVTEWVGRAFRRHWWQIIPLWGLATVALWFALIRSFPNTFEATSEVEIDAGTRAGGGRNDAGSDAAFNTLKETQVRRIVNPTIVKAALDPKPDLADRLAVDTKARDPESAILSGISAELQPKTNVILVSLTAGKDDALAQIVDGLIEEYLQVANDFNEQGASQRSSKLRSLADAKNIQVKNKQDAVARMVSKTGTLDANQGRERHATAIEQLASISDQLLKIDSEVIEEQYRLERTRQDEAQEAAKPRPAVVADPKAAAKAFYLLPEVVALQNQLDEVERAKREPARKPGEPTAKALQEKADKLQDQINVLWAKLGPVLRIAAQNEPAPVAAPVLESPRIDARLTGLKARQALLNERLAKLQGEALAGGSEVLALEFARKDLQRAETVLDTMTQTLSQDELAASEPVARVRQLYRAKTTERSQGLTRWSIGTVVPLLLFLGLLGFFGLIEKQTGRILDPSDLPSKAQLNVIGLVPPLPRTRGSRLGGAQQRSQMDFERFIQSLDQLRVLICGRGDGQGRLRRSLLITSAGENEGKSTLAAQLAERSVNAGLLTLLIDADLRNPTLSRMFDRPESVGLANVLRGELLAEEAICTVPEAGGFHFLAAGLVRDDLSRLLQSDRLARLLESARESFDLVLVDSPPVLPVADALTIGQWVDGAILTVRHKVSRLPLVERASRQLSSVGIEIIGAVVNGVRDRHAPYYGSRPAADPDRSSSVDSAI